jgi:hypothetical protein
LSNFTHTGFMKGIALVESGGGCTATDKAKNAMAAGTVCRKD